MTKYMSWCVHVAIIMIINILENVSTEIICLNYWATILSF